MTTAIKRLENGNIELLITIPWKTIAETYDSVVEEKVANTEIAGFRKGKAPRKVVEEKLDRSKVYEDVIQKLIPTLYAQAVQEQKIKPIISPKIELKQAEEKKDWILNIITCEKPEIKLGEYKKAIQEVKSSKTKKIWTPGQNQAEEKDKDKPQKPTMDELLKAVFENVTATIPAILVEQEANRLLSDLIDQTRKLGMSVEQYLSSTGKTSESIRKEYEEQASRTITLEFALEQIADKEGVLISDDDIAAVIKTAKTEDEKKALEQQRYYVASVLRRQKTLDFLAGI